MENYTQINYNVHNLTFLRNNSYAQPIDFDEEQNCFFMMDYYNLLKERKLKSETEGYRVLEGASKGEKNAVAKRVMGIYAKGDSSGADVFQVAPMGAGQTTERPFLGIIQVYITDYLWMKKDHMDTQDIDNYLESYKKEIEDCVKAVLTKDNDIYQIFRTVTSEDFCVIIRTSKFRNIYDAALKVMGVKDTQHGRRVFFTYTNIGIECVKCKEKTAAGNITRFIKLHKSVLNMNQDMKFVLRFRIENEALAEIQAIELESLQENKDEPAEQFVIEAVNGMVGRYDLVVQFNINEFMKIYPFLCMNITGCEIASVGGEDFTDAQLVGTVVKKMKDGSIQTINTRVIMNIYAKGNQEKAEAVSLLDKDDMNRIKQRTDKVMDLYKKFQRKHKTKFLMEKYRYSELSNMLDSLINSYENLAYEIDTHVNWFVCSQYLEELFQSMDSYMDYVGSRPVHMAIEKFLTEFQAFVSAFDVFLRLLQGINQNTIQAPRYDISAPVDGQKFLIAYSEFIDRIQDGCREQSESQDSVNCCGKCKPVKTILYPDLTIKNLELMEVFSYDRVEEQGDRSEKATIRICKIPMFEYFERPYDLIPLVSHEICHHMQSSKREVRNEFLIGSVFKRVASEAVKEVQIRFVKGKYVIRNDALTCSIVESLADSLLKDFKAQNPNWAKYVFAHLTNQFRNYVHFYFEEEKKKRNNQFPANSPESVIKKFELLMRELSVNAEGELKKFKEYYFGKKDSRDNQQDSQDGQQDSQRGQYDLQQDIRNLVERLLVKTNDLTIQYKEQPIGLEALQNKNNRELDKYLLQWANKNEMEILNQKEQKTEEKRQQIKYYLDLVKRIFVLYMEAVTVQKNEVGVRREELAKEFAKETKAKVEKFLDEKQYYYIYDPDKVEKVAFWELKKEEKAKEHYLEAMDCIEPEKISDAIEFEVTKYREVCADTIMCRWLGLNSFGYFRMSITLGQRMQGYTKQMQYGGMQQERLVTVLAVLLNDENPGCVERDGEWAEMSLKALQEKVWKYIREAVKYAKERIEETMRSDKLEEEVSKRISDEFFIMLEGIIRSAEKDVLENKKLAWEDSFWDLLCRDELPFFDEIPTYKQYFQKEVNVFKRLYEMLDAYTRVQRGNKLYIETDVLDHMTDVYRNMSENKSPHKVVQEVVNFYNDPESEKKTNAQKMVDMLQFVQDYYYCNRIKKAEESKDEYVVCEEPE